MRFLLHSRAGLWRECTVAAVVTLTARGRPLHPGVVVHRAVPLRQPGRGAGRHVLLRPLAHIRGSNPDQTHVHMGAISS